MSKIRYTDEFKSEAVKQVLERGNSVREVAQRLGINKHSLYDWTQKAKMLQAQAGESVPPGLLPDSSEVRRLKAELRRVTEERDILKKAAAYFARG